MIAASALGMCIVGAFNYMVIYYFCHKTPALIRWQYSAASWLTFCSPSKLWIIISSANIQTLLLMTLSQAPPNKLLVFFLQNRTLKTNIQHQHCSPTNLFIALTSPRDSGWSASVTTCVFIQLHRGNENRNLRAPTTLQAWRGVS